MQELSEKEYFKLTKDILAGDTPWKSHEEQIDLLSDLIRYHDWRYYVRNDPVVSDYEYDVLYSALEAAEAEHPDLIRKDSPTQRVSADLTDLLPSVDHLNPMLSLANSYDETDMLEFDKQIRRLHDFSPDRLIEYCVEPKFDGGSIAVLYEDNAYVRGATRGDGVRGEEITQNIRALRSVPLSARFSDLGIWRIELRGEALISKKDFEKVNEEREQAAAVLFANPRNAAAGGLRMKDPSETARRRIVAFIYQISKCEDRQGNTLYPFETHNDGIDFLHEAGFLVPHREKRVCSGIAEVIDYCRAWEEKRDTYPYEIDGMVVKLNNVQLQLRSGSTSHHPRWAIAFKFKAKQGTTKLIGVEFQVGKIGSITPVAKLEPISLAGVTISSVSLHNEEFIRSKDIRIGDHVLVERAGDVIPYIVKVLEDLRTGNEQIIDFPAKCPVCKTPLVKKEGEAAWRCDNYECEAQVLQRLMHFVSKDALDIEGLGPSIIERLYRLGWVKRIPDIYTLDYDKIAGLEGFGAKSVENLKQSIDQSRQQPIHRFLFGLAIHHLGKRASKILSQKLDNVLDLQGWTYEDLVSIKDIGPVLAENVTAFFSVPSNVQMLRELEDLGVNLSATEEDRPKPISEAGPLVHKTILFTGTLQSLTRSEAQKLAEENGARVLSGVSGKLDILVIGDNPGSKLEKARVLNNIEIISEEEFLKRVNSLQ